MKRGNETQNQRRGILIFEFPSVRRRRTKRRSYLRARFRYTYRHRRVWTAHARRFVYANNISDTFRSTAQVTARTFVGKLGRFGFRTGCPSLSVYFLVRTYRTARVSIGERTTAWIHAPLPFNLAAGADRLGFFPFPKYVFVRTKNPDPAAFPNERISLFPFFVRPAFVSGNDQTPRRARQTGLTTGPVNPLGSFYVSALIFSVPLPPQTRQ